MIRELRDGDLASIARIWRELRPDAMHLNRRLGYRAFTERRGA